MACRRVYGGYAQNFDKIGRSHPDMTCSMRIMQKKKLTTTIIICQSYQTAMHDAHQPLYNPRKQATSQSESVVMPQITFTMPRDKRCQWGRKKKSPSSPEVDRGVALNGSEVGKKPWLLLGKTLLSPRCTWTPRQSLQMEEINNKTRDSFPDNLKTHDVDDQHI
jgi:hypothetical protein